MQQQLSQETGIKQEVLAKLLPTETEQPNQHRANRQPDTPQLGQKKYNHASTLQSDASSSYDDHQYNNSEDQDVNVGDFIDTDDAKRLLPGSNTIEDKQLALLTQKALHLLVKFPESAQRIELLENFEPEDESERLLCEILKKLKQSPQSSSIGLLIQWTGTPFSEQLKKIANQTLELPEGIDHSGDIQGTLQNLQLRLLRREFQTLQNKITTTSFSSLTKEEKARYVALPRQLKKVQKITDP
jgi:DNA primase